MSGDACIGQDGPVRDDERSDALATRPARPLTVTDVMRRSPTNQ